MSQFFERVSTLTSRMFLHIFGKELVITVKGDQKFDYSSRGDPRLYIQLVYHAPDTKDLSKIKEYRGRKWYLSEYMPDDEIVKTCYLAFRTAVEHEVLEGFKIDDKVLFNPHVNFEELLKISDREVARTPIH